MAALGELDTSDHVGPRLRNPPRIVLGFLLRVVLAYAFLVGPWPDFRRPYALTYREAVNRLVPLLSLDQPIRLVECTAPDRRIASCAIQRDVVTGAPITRVHRGDQLAFLSTALLAALIVATPVRRAGRCRALGLGLVLLSGCLAVRVALHFLLLHASDPLAWLPLPLAERRGLLRAAAYPPWFLAPTFVWVLVVAGRVYEELLNREAPGC